jgi:hypothetical protein
MAFDMILEPLICTEVDFMNPRIRLVWEMTNGTDWLLFYHGHDGFMLEGPKLDAYSFGTAMLAAIPTHHAYAPGIDLYVPFSFKGGDNWAYLGKVNDE